MGRSMLLTSNDIQCGCGAGAATPDIISQYVGCIKALREVDPAGILLNAVGGPIKAYLRSRRDTIRCILASLTDDHDGGEATHSESLFEELQQPPQPEVCFVLGMKLACQTVSVAHPQSVGVSGNVRHEKLLPKADLVQQCTLQQQPSTCWCQ